MGLVGVLMGTLIFVIMLVAVAIPIVADVLTNQSFTGTTKTVTDLFVPMLAIVGLVVIVGLIRE